MINVGLEDWLPAKEVSRRNSSLEDLPVFGAQCPKSAGFDELAVMSGYKP